MKLKFTILLLIIIYMLTGCQEEKASLAITMNGIQNVIDTESIYNSTGSVVFPAVVRSSGEKPVETEYKGIELSILLTQNNFEFSDYDKIIINATDGYRIILNTEELKEPSNVYLTFERDGEILKSKKQGGNGPFQLVIRRDPFSQRWVKHVNEIVLE